MLRSVRARVTLAATAVVVAVLSATGAALVAAQTAVLVDNVDEALDSRVSALLAQVDQLVAGGTIPATGDEDAFARLLDASGSEVASTAVFPSGLVLPDFSAPISHLSLAAPDGVEYRLLARRTGDLFLVVGTPLDDVQESTGALIWALLAAVPAASVLLALLLWVIVGRVLRPVERIRRQVEAIGGDSLDRRVPVPRSGDEVARLAETMNQMLARIEASSERQRRFVADASHELRSPLTRMRTDLEIDLAHPASADLPKTHRGLLDATVELQTLVEDLLALARSDVGGYEPRKDAVDLDDILFAEVARRPPAERVDVTGVSAAQVTGDAAQLARVVRNLLDNAFLHGGGGVRADLHEKEGAAVLGVSDTGAGVPAEFRARLFERFSQADEARTGRSGAGLGLAIAHGIIAAHGGTLVLDEAFTRGTRFEVRLPLAG